MESHISKYNLEKLAIHALIEPGFAFKSEKFLDDSSNIALVKGENVQQGFINWEASKYWDIEDADNYKKYYLEVNDVILAMDRPWVTSGLKWAYIKEHDPKALLVQRVSRLRGKETLNQTYLRCLISSNYFTGYIQPIVTGVNVPHISGKQIGDFKIPLPPIETQKKIAAVISTYDDLIENNKRRIALLEKMAEEIYREWFVRMRFPGYKETKFEKGLPIDWKQMNVGQVCKVARGSSPRPINDSRYFDNGTIPWVKIADATASKMYIFETKEHVNIFGASFSRKLSPGSLIIAASGTLGFCIFLGVEGCVHDGWMYLADYEYETKPIFFYYLINNFREQLNNSSYGAAIQNINTDIIRRLTFLLPPEDLLTAFYSQVEPIHANIINLGKRNLNLENTQNRLLSRLISGKLSVENLDIQFPPSMGEDVEKEESANA